MSVIIWNEKENSLRAFVKGAPEKIMAMCEFDTVPFNFHETLTLYTQEGFRVLAIAYKDLSTDDLDLDWDDIESNLNFLGFIIM